MYTLTYAQLTEEFHVSRVVTTLGLSTFVMGLGIGPMVLAPLSEVSLSTAEVPPAECKAPIGAYVCCRWVL